MDKATEKYIHDLGEYGQITSRAPETPQSTTAAATSSEPNPYRVLAGLSIGLSIALILVGFYWIAVPDNAPTIFDTKMDIEDLINVNRGIGIICAGVAFAALAAAFAVLSPKK